MQTHSTTKRLVAIRFTGDNTDELQKFSGLVASLKGMSLPLQRRFVEILNPDTDFNVTVPYGYYLVKVDNSHAIYLVIDERQFKILFQPNVIAGW